MHVEAGYVESNKNTACLFTLDVRQGFAQAARLDHDQTKRNARRSTFALFHRDLARIFSKGDISTTAAIATYRGSAQQCIHTAYFWREEFHQHRDPMVAHQQALVKRIPDHCAILHWLQRRAAEDRYHPQPRV